MSSNDNIEEQNKLLRALLKVMIDNRFEEKTEAEKARYLLSLGFTHGETAKILNKSKSTINSQVSS